MHATSIVVWGILGALIGSVIRPIANRIIRARHAEGPVVPPLVLEAVSAASFAGLAWRTGALAELLAFSWLAALEVSLAAIDLSIGRLPNCLILVTYAGLILQLGVATVVDNAASSMLRTPIGMAVLAGFHLALYLLAPGQLGGGDVKLAGVLGLALGWAGWSLVFSGALLDWLLAACTVLVVRMVGGAP